MLFPQRTTTCGGLTLAQADTEVVLNGWVHRLRHQGGVAFITLRDRYGTTQVVVDERSPRACSSRPVRSRASTVWP